MELYFAAQPPDSTSDLTWRRKPVDDPRVAFFMRRLARLLKLRALTNGCSDPVDARLLDYAIYSTYRDLQALGCEEQARALLRDNGPRG